MGGKIKYFTIGKVKMKKMKKKKEKIVNFGHQTAQKMKRFRDSAACRVGDNSGRVFFFLQNLGGLRKPPLASLLLNTIIKSKKCIFLFSQGVPLTSIIQHRGLFTIIAKKKNEITKK